MIRAIWFQERLDFFSRGPTLVALVIVLIATVYAGWSGDRWRDGLTQSLTEFETEKLESLASFKASLEKIERGEAAPTLYDANPMSITIPAILPPAPLSDFAVGHADLHPTSAEISPWRNLWSVFGRYQFDNPTTLSAGAFDLALVVIMLMPIMMIALSFDVLARDRSRRLLPLIIASPFSLPRLVWSRLLLRNGALWIVAISAMVLLALINSHGSGGERTARFLLWLGACSLYAAFWLAVIAYCVARFRSATATAGAMVGVWLLLTLALPGVLASIGEALYPTPSRLAFLSEIRQAQGDTNSNLTDLTSGYLMDHPELSVSQDEIPAYYRAAFLSNEAARESTREIVEAYGSAREGRERTFSWAQYLAPTVLIQRLLTQFAGADLARQHQFQTLSLIHI